MMSLMSAPILVSRSSRGMITWSCAKPATAPLSHMMTMSGGAPPATAAAISSVWMSPLMPLIWIDGFWAFQAWITFSMALTSSSPPQQYRRVSVTAWAGADAGALPVDVDAAAALLSGVDAGAALPQAVAIRALAIARATSLDLIPDLLQ